MTTRTELLEIISNGENSGVEFKRDVIENHALARELVAFSNLSGGIVLLGVEDDGTISGTTRAALEEWVMTTCRDKIRPAIIPFFEKIREVEPGKDVAVVRVPPGFDVHSLWHNNRNTYFIRVGTQSREPAPEELGRLFQQRAPSVPNCDLYQGLHWLTWICAACVTTSPVSDSSIPGCCGCRRLADLAAKHRDHGRRRHHCQRPVALREGSQSLSASCRR